MAAIRIEWESVVGPQYAAIVATVADAEFTPACSVRLLGNDIDYANTCIGSKIQALTTAKNLDRFDHVRIDQGRAPNFFDARAAIIQRHTVQSD